MIFAHKVKLSNIATIPIKYIISCTEKPKSIPHKASNILYMY